MLCCCVGKQIKQRATDLVIEHLPSDLFLIYDASEVACAAVMLASEICGLSKEESEKFWASKVPSAEHMNRVTHITH